MTPNLSRFVEDRRGAWDELAALLARLESGSLTLAELDRLDRLYREAAGDLAFAQHAFPGSDAAGFLNQLTARAYAAIYRQRPRPLKRLGAFFGAEVPDAFRALRPYAAAAALLLAAGAATGAVATLVDERVAEALAPPELVQGVREGRMWTDDILTVAPASVVSTKILTNNVGVTFTVFLLGLCFALPAGLVLFFNGFLVGALGALCARYGLLVKFLDFVLSHGLLELTLICLAGGAGLALGMALVDPGDRPRGEAVRERARQGVRLVLGTAPAMVLLGFVEGYVSPGDLFPTWAKALVGVSLEAVTLAYLFGVARSSARSGGAGTGGTARARIRS